MFDMIVELASRGHAVSLYTPEDRKGSAKTLDLLKPHLKSYRLVQQGSFRASDYQSWLRRENTKFDAIHYVWPNCATLIPAGRDWTRTSLFELIESCTRRCLIDIERFLEPAKSMLLSVRPSSWSSTGSSSRRRSPPQTRLLRSLTRMRNFLPRCSAWQR